jgi:predicted cobalt transporter CbtA
VLLSLLGKSAFLIEWLSVVALRQRIGYPSEVPAVSAADFAESILMWGVAVVRGALSPGRWHRARPEA